VYLPPWADPDRHPFFILADNKLAGFALIRFEAARARWRLYPGTWRLRVLGSNESAYPFWKNLISAYSHEQFKEMKEENPTGRGTVFTFDSQLQG